MSVIFLPPSAGAASVPDATETVSGKIRIATNAEATTGTDDLTAMTPAKVKTVVDAAVVGGVTYKGTFDTSSPVDLSNALKGDMYVISVAGTYQGIVWAVGDHLLINEDMGGTVSPSKIDKVDNSDSVTSVAGKTGAVTLVPSDITGLATVASTGSYSDLSGTPTLGTAAAEDVGTSASNVVQLDGSARLPAVDGSQLINLPSSSVFYDTAITSLGATLSQITDNRRQHYDIQLCNPANPITMPAATSAAIGGVVSFFNSDGISQAVINCPSIRLLSGSAVTSFTVEPYESRSFVWVGASALQEITATRIDRLNDVSVSSPSGGEALVFNGTLSVFENATVSASVPNASETVAGIIEISTNTEATAASATDKALVPSNLSSINVSTLNNDAGYLTDITGENIGDLADVTITSIAAGESLVYNGTLSVFQNATISASVPSASETVEGIIEISTNAEATAATATNKALVPSNLSSINVSTLNNDAGYTDTAFDVIAVTGTTTLSSSLADGHYLVTVDGAHTVTIPAYSADANIVLSFRHINTGAGDATIYYGTGQSQLFEYDTNTGQFSLPLSDSGAMRTFALRWTGSAASSQYWYELQPSSLNSLPDVSYTAGAGIDNYVLTYDHSTSTWGAAPSAGGGGASLPTVTTTATSYTVPARTTELAVTVLVNNGASAVTITLPSIASGDIGFTIDVKVLGTGSVTIDAGSNFIDDGTTTSISVNTQYDSRTLQAGSTTDWYII